MKKREKREQPPETGAEERRPEVKPEAKGKGGKKWKIGLILIGAYLLVVAAVILAADGRHIRFYISGLEDMTVECGQPYVEPGCYAVSVGRLFGEGKRQLPIRTEGLLDTAKVGTYELHYVARYLLREYEVQRRVTVVDTTAPQLTLKHSEGYAPSWLDGYQEEGYTAWDFCDGDLTEQVQREVFEDRIVYTVSDSAGNKTSVERRPEYSVTAPTLELIGGERMELQACMIFNDPGCRAVDSMGNDLSQYVQVEGEVTPYVPGQYRLVYSVSNAVGDTVSAVRLVNILAAERMETVEPDHNTIYLTFDDGPGPYTERLLDLLKAYGVKATFFVTCSYPDYQDMVGRAFREGHSIGVHSATHNYYEIYASEEAFFEDFNTVQDMIYEQTGSYTNLLRFPGGSSNTVSSFNSGIMSRLTEAVTDMGYQYFDWNVTSGDAGETTDTKKIGDNIIDGCAGRRASIVLQHDIKDYSVAAVERVINWGLSNGYHFSALNLTSPAAHHGIAN